MIDVLIIDMATLETEITINLKIQNDHTWISVLLIKTFFLKYLTSLRLLDFFHGNNALS